MYYRIERGSDVTAVYTWDVFSTLDGYGSYGEDGDWGGYWGKQGPELLERRGEVFDEGSEWSWGPIRFGNVQKILGPDPKPLDQLKVADDATCQQRWCPPH